jgi:hypothetical protein
VSGTGGGSDGGSEPGAGQTPEQRRALFRVVRGEPGDEELAALTVVLAAVSSAAGPAEESDRGTSVWVDRQAALRRPLHPGPGVWKASVLPR